MANAAFSTLVSQATISTINNGGNLGAVLKELGSSASIKQLATSVATAGALQGLDQAMGVASAAPAASNAASQPACGLQSVLLGHLQPGDQSLGRDRRD
ncbi:DUF637 domain-containing protein [Aeromonas dhakensis]|uniref:DUF637 domain-containing protein n=1 Tax=Aeromonas dhakensis TaxID=196024 RepID=UPI003C7A1BBD